MTTPNMGFDVVHRDAFAAFAFRTVRFVGGGVVVAFLGASVARLGDDMRPGAGAIIYPAILGIYGVSVLLNMVVAARAWPRSEQDASVRLVIPADSEDRGEITLGPVGQARLHFATELRSRGLAAIEVIGLPDMALEIVALEFVDGAVWRLKVPPQHSTLWGSANPPIRIEIATDALTLKSLRHGRVIGSTLRDTSGRERRAKVSLESVPLPPRPVLVA